MTRAQTWFFSLCAYVCGVGLQLQQAALWPWQWYAALLGAALLLALLLRRWRLPPWPQGLAWLLIFALLGFASTGWRATHKLAQQSLAPELIGQDLWLDGVVQGMPKQEAGNRRFVLAVQAARHAQGGAVQGLPQRVSLVWYGHQRVALLPQSLVAEADLQQPLQAGQRWRVQVRLKPIHGSQNPHGFDYELWAFQRGLGANGYVRGAALLSPAATGWRAALPQHWASTVARWRQASRAAVLAHIADERQAGVVAALLMGDQNAISQSDWQVFRATGVAHLVSISGLHIGLFAALAIFSIKALWRRSQRLAYAWPALYAAWLGGVALATAYAYFTGWGVPAQRTVLMLLGLTLLRLSGRRWPWPFALLFVAVLVLLMDPWALLQAGFWLSFVAVAVLLLPSQPKAELTAAEQAQQELYALVPRPWWQRQLRALGRWLLDLWRLQWRVSLALAPLTLLLFQQASVVGLLANMLAIPIVTFVLTPLALLGLLLRPLWTLAAWILQYLLAFLVWCASLPAAVWHSPALPAAGLLAAALLVAALFYVQAQWPAGQGRRRGVAALLALLLGLAWAGWRYEAPRPPPGELRLLFVDVGQGNAILVQTAKHALLYDTGPRYGPVDSGRDAGERTLLPLLRALGQKLDVLMVSHSDSDHSGGVLPLLKQWPPQRLLGSMAAEAAWPAAPPIEACTAGQSWVWDGVQFEVLHPQVADYQRPLSSNAMSCVLRIRAAGGSVLLTGDIPAAQEYDLWLQRPAEDLASTVLLSPHHGSKTSSGILFLKAVAPQWVVVQSAYLSRYGHPAPEVMARYADLGFKVVSNAECGAITWQSQQPQHMGCLRRDAPRYWWHRLAPP